jgi:hypothetical protein
MPALARQSGQVSYIIIPVKVGPFKKPDLGKN